MFEWQKRVQIYRAENALRDGRLDEAFTIVTQKDLQEWRACQVVLEKLVQPLVDRAAVHFQEGRLRDALLDVERAQAAGGNQPRVAELRARIQEKLQAEAREEARERRLLESARRHLAQGSIGAGRAALQELPAAAPEAERLRREAEHREERGRQSCLRAELLLGQGALLEALRAAREAREDNPREEKLASLLIALKPPACAAVERALDEGSLGVAEELLGILVEACGESVETRTWGEALDLCRAARGRLEAQDYGGAQASLERLETLAARTSWVAAARSALEKVAEGLRTLSAGPLGSPLPRLRTPGSSTVVGPRRNAARVTPLPGLPFSDRFLLWVDGVGSYLVLRGDRVTIGRAGSSSRPDLALAADISGVQAEVVRVDEDYFLAAHGPVEINGRRVERKLLADGDRIRFAPRCELVFRLPTALSTTALLSLAGSQRVAGDVREVILLDHHLLLGQGSQCHVRASRALEQVVISAEKRGLVVRAPEGVCIDGRPQGSEALAAPGVQLQVGEVTFTLGPVDGERLLTERS